HTRFSRDWSSDVCSSDLVTALAGITGSASGGMSIALAAMSETFIVNAQAAGIPMDVLHRIAAMASGGMDSLPHNGAVITLLAVKIGRASCREGGQDWVVD